jgi:type II secretory pathway component GspD/PulD (secretin)
MLLRALSILPCLLILAACASSEAPAARPEAQPPSPEAQARPQPQPQPQPGQPQDEWSRAMDQFLKKHAVAEQESEFMAQEHFRLAERFFTEGKLENSEMSAREALRYNPKHAGAMALLYETQVLLGRGQASPLSQQLNSVINQVQAQQQQVRLEINEHFNRGMRFYNTAQYADAERAFRMVVEYSKWVYPPSVEVDTRRQQAVEMLEKTKQASRQHSLDEERIKYRLLAEEERIRTTSELVEQKKEMEIMFSQAQLHFEREEYEACMIICDKLLYRNPNLSSVKEMKMVAQRLKLMKKEHALLDDYIRHWKKSQNYAEFLGGVPADLVEFPAFDTWMQISKRQPRTLHFEEAEQLAEGDRAIVEKLQAMKFSFEWSDTPLSQVIDFLREATGLNFIFESGVDSSTTVTFNVKDISIDALLRYILKPSDFTYYVDEGIVHITDQSTFAAKQIRLEIFDVQDITFRLLDMPGREITFGDEGVQFVDTPAEAQPQFGGEDLVQLIRDTVNKPTWEMEGRDILFQNGLLIVRQTTDVMKNISKFLTMLRGSTGILVHVESRFMFVDDNWMQQVGMDLRDLGPDLPELIPDNTGGFSFLGPFPYFVATPTGGATTAGISGTLGPNAAPFAARVQNLMFNDYLRNKFFQEVIAPFGGGSFRYQIADDISMSAFIRLVSKTQKGYALAAPRVTMFNTQRAHIQISNQMAYVRDWNVGGGGFVAIADPIIDVISDGIILDVKPIVSSDRKYVTMEVRATVALLWPPPPQITQIVHRAFTLVGGPPTVIELPFVRMNKIKTTVIVPDGGVTVLGGFSGYFDAHFESGIPIWKHIPVLGQMGKEEIRGKGRKQLLVLMRSDIVIPTDEEKKKFD